MGVVVSINYKRSFLKKWFHYFFKCPTFWTLKPKFKCPVCGKLYRCYWDGHDEKGYTNLCGVCYSNLVKGD